MTGEQFEEFVRQHREHRDRLRMMIAYSVVSLGHEPRCWAETLEIARELVAGKRKRRAQGLA